MKQNSLRLWPLLVILLLLCSGCAAPSTKLGGSEIAAPAQSAAQVGELTAVFFDVGQADSILVSNGGSYMLVDAGNTGQDTLLTGYLREYGISRLDYLIATHPHADHIGAMAAVIDALDEIGAVLMPDIVATTVTFENLLDTIERRNLRITVPEPGESFPLGQAMVEILAPQSGDYEDLNNYSIVLRISLGQISFLLTGDAEAFSENQQLQSGQRLAADVLKAGHHGSNSSSTDSYLDAVAPKYAVISCGLDNSYGHPHAEVLERLAARNITVYRTDECGTIEITTDGQQISVKGAITASLPPAEPAIAAIEPEATEPDSGYIGNRNSHVFHLPTCATLPAEHNRIPFTTREEAIQQDYRACGNCKP